MAVIQDSSWIISVKVWISLDVLPQFFGTETSWNHFTPAILKVQQNGLVPFIFWVWYFASSLQYYNEQNKFWDVWIITDYTFVVIKLICTSFSSTHLMQYSVPLNMFGSKNSICFTVLPGSFLHTSKTSSSIRNEDFAQWLYTCTEKHRSFIGW